MYKVIWNYRATDVDEDIGDEASFDNHEDAQAFFYTIMRRPGVSGAEMRTFTEEEISAYDLENSSK